MNYSKIIGRPITPAAAAAMDKITAEIERIHADHPEIPESMLWGKAADIISAEIQRARE